MKLILINSSIVLVTRNHVSSVSHRFLVNQKIIPEDFQQKGNSFSSPVVSQIQYNNGFNVIIEPNKTLFQFANNNTNDQENLKNLKTLKEISSKYIEVFKHIEYQTMGINFDFIRDDLKYNAIVEQIVKQDSPYLNFEKNTGKVHNIDLSYNLEGIQFNVSIRKVEKKISTFSTQSSTQNFVPFFRINAHYPNEYANNKITIIEETEKNYKRSKNFIEKFL